VGGLVAQALPRCGQFQAQPFGVVERAGEAFLQLADLAAGAGDELVDLPAAIAAHLNFEGVFLLGV